MQECEDGWSRAIHYKINDDVCAFHLVLYATLAKMAELSSDVTETATEDTDVDVDGEPCMHRAASHSQHHNTDDYHAWYICDSRACKA